MIGFLARRAALGFLTLWLVSVVVFALIRIAPGDAVTAALAMAPGEGGLSQEQIDSRRAELGLDRNWAVQYMDWLGDAVQLNAGDSLSTGEPVLDELGARVSVTVELALLTLALTVALGVGGGLIAARRAGTSLDIVLRALAFAGLSTPAFWIGLLLIVGAAAWTDTFLASRFEPFGRDPVANFFAILPAAAVLAIRPSALTLRVARSSTLDAANSRFFLMARSKGVSHGTAMTRHAFRAAALPTVTLIGAQAVFLLGGAVVIEQVFGLPGLGRGLVTATQERDYPVVQAIVMVFGTAAVTINLLVDAVYARLDPRVRLVV